MNHIPIQLDREDRRSYLEIAVLLVGLMANGFIDKQFELYHNIQIIMTTVVASMNSDPVIMRWRDVILNWV